MTPLRLLLSTLKLRWVVFDIDGSSTCYLSSSQWQNGSRLKLTDQKMTNEITWQHVIIRTYFMRFERLNKLINKTFNFFVFFIGYRAEGKEHSLQSLCIFKQFIEPIFGCCQIFPWFIWKTIWFSFCSCICHVHIPISYVKVYDSRFCCAFFNSLH